MHVVIIGNSAAGLSALDSFRKENKDAKVTLISKEGGIAYSRVLLPYYLRGKADYDNFFIRDKKYYEDMDVDYIEETVEGVDDKKKVVSLENGGQISYDKLLIATGSRAVSPPIPGLDAEGVYNMWTLKDAESLEKHFEKDKRVMVLGSGFVSLQAAWAALFKGLEVTIVELVSRIMPNVLDDKGAELLSDSIRELGADLRVNTMTEKIEKLEDGSFRVYTKDNEPFEVDFIVVGTGVRANIALVNGTDIKTDRGILVDEFMETSVKDVYSAGDVAQGPTTFGDKHVIHALWPTAIEMGKIAGNNLAGKPFPYEGSLNMNTTQMFELTVSSMGRFNEGEGDRVEVLDGSVFGGKGYIKLVFENDKVIGATAVGSTSIVPLLGKLRPLIRKKTVIDVPVEKLGAYLHLQIAKSNPRNIMKSIKSL
jgi:NAD(P)H-nitrite reductase large subunit